MPTNGDSAYELSVPWTRTSLLNTPTYVASSDFISHVTWLKTGNQNDLVLVPTDLESQSSKRATCAVVGTVSPTRIFLEPHGNYNPNYEKTALETSKAQFQLVSPTIHPEFNVDFTLGIDHIESVQDMAIKEGPRAEHFVVADGLKKALKFSWPLFEKRDHPYDPMDDEDWSTDYPIAFKYRDAYNDIVTRWRVTPLPAFDASGKFIKTAELEVALMGSLVLVYFELKHYPIRDKKTFGVAGNTFTAIATQVKILERGSARRPSPYKSLLLNGPTILPQSPSKKKDQLAAANAFHPAMASHASGSGTGSSNLDVAQQIPPISLKKEGKKRSANEEDEATATDEDTPLPDQATKKRRTHLK